VDVIVRRHLVLSEKERGGTPSATTVQKQLGSWRSRWQFRGQNSWDRNVLLLD
jgi:hypothetical protein